MNGRAIESGDKHDRWSEPINLPSPANAGFCFWGDLMTTSASTVGLPEDKAYIIHHFNCATCCADGLLLWETYLQVFDAHAQLQPRSQSSRRPGPQHP